ncbi:hypothetical protein EVJ24_01465 [Exiguobacterium sp. SH1S21]|uniref:hypothetical protein n=1 Tax=Exiguobacterium sp. SH1S21 TaxID=2510953 RepID=UPI00103D92E6|nr:hypothetical protein [Exiguobacterium sp. SH1S21]TCI57472.1 hypothetical protein EVJ24_01465 [Exiguobacterium sp. SH1S21]
MIYTQNRNAIKWTEMLVSILIIGIFDYIFNLSISDWAIDPLIFYILLFSLRYGLLGAFVSFTLTSIYHFMFLLSQGTDLLLFLYDANELAWILLHFFIAIFAGIFSTSFQERYQSLRIRQEEVADENRQLKETVRHLELSQVEMRKKVLDSDYTLSKIYEIGLGLDQDLPDIVRDQLVRTLEQSFYAKQIAIYHVDTSQRTLRLHVRSGEASRLPQTLFIEAGQGLYERMLRTGKLSIRTADETDVPLLIAPIRYDGAIQEVVVIQEVDFNKLRSYEMNMMQLILDWAGTRIEKARAMEWMLARNELVDGTHIYHVAAFEEKVKLQAVRHEQYDQPYSTLALAVDHINLSLIEMELILRQAMREIDIIGYDAETETLHFLLPGTPKEFAERFKERMEQTFLVKGGQKR